MNLFSIVKKETQKLNIIGAYASLSAVSERGSGKSLSMHLPPITVTYDWTMTRTYSGEYLDEQLENQEQFADILEKHKKTVYATIVEFEDKHRRQRRKLVLPKLLDEIVKLPLLPLRWALAGYVARNYKLQQRSYELIRRVSHDAEGHFSEMLVPGELKQKATKCAAAAGKISELSTQLSNLTSHIPLRVMAIFRSNYSYFIKQIKYEE